MSLKDQFKERLQLAIAKELNGIEHTIHKIWESAICGAIGVDRSWSKPKLSDGYIANSVKNIVMREVEKELDNTVTKIVRKHFKYSWVKKAMDDCVRQQLSYSFQQLVKSKVEDGISKAADRYANAILAKFESEALDATAINDDLLDPDYCTGTIGDALLRFNFPDDILFADGKDE